MDFPTGTVVPQPDNNNRHAARNQATTALRNNATFRVAGQANIATTSARLLEFYQNGSGAGVQLPVSTTAPIGWNVIARPQDAWFVSYLAQQRGISTQQAQQLVANLNIVVGQQHGPVQPRRAESRDQSARPIVLRGAGRGAKRACGDCDTNAGAADASEHRCAISRSDLESGVQQPVRQYFWKCVPLRERHYRSVLRWILSRGQSCSGWLQYPYRSLRVAVYSWRGYGCHTLLHEQRLHSKTARRPTRVP